MISAFDWLAQNSNPNERVLSNDTYGLLIPALAGNMPYLSLQAQQIDQYPQLQANTVRFLNNWMGEKDAQKFINEENISFVFSEGPMAYSFLKPVFSNSKIFIYSP